MHYFWSRFIYLPFVTLVLFLGFTVNAFAAFEIDVNQDAPVLIGKGLQFVEDEANAYSIDSITSRDIQWQTNTERVFNQGYSSSYWWLKFNIENVGSVSSFLLEVSYPVLDYVDIYFVEENVMISQYSMGDKLPFSERPIQHRESTSLS